MTGPAQSQQQQCRTAPVGTISEFCASEAFVTNSVAPAWVAYSPTIVPTSGSFTTVTINSASYVVIGKLLYVQFDFTITTIGTGAGFIDIQVPSYNSIVLCSAFELNNGAGMGTATAASSTTIRLKLYNNGASAAANARWQGGALLRLS